jgi:hypothetical protein
MVVPAGWGRQRLPPCARLLGLVTLAWWGWPRMPSEAVSSTQLHLTNESIQHERVCSQVVT